MATAPRRLCISPVLMIPIFFLLLLPFSTPIATSQQLTPSVATIDVDAANRLLTLPTSPYRFLDVRTAKEFAHGHVGGAVNAPYLFFTEDGGTARNPEFLKLVEREFTKGDPIVVGCLAGVRSLKAAEELVGAGFRDVKDLGGGIRAWVDKGLPVVKHSVAPKYKEAAEL